MYILEMYGKPNGCLGKINEAYQYKLVMGMCFVYEESSSYVLNIL
jgi:hypothetical protein